MSRSVPPPSSQEIARKLSIVRSPPKKSATVPIPIPGTESDSDVSVFSPDAAPVSAPLSSSLLSSTSQQPQLSSIAERRSGSGEESDDDDDDDDGEEDQDEAGGVPNEARERARGTLDDTVIKNGYLWKKGERRKTWKKRWFVLRPNHLAFYKTNAEYKLLRLLDLNEVHSCTPVALKKHANTFGLISPARTFYLQAANAKDVQEWVKAIDDARTTLLATSTLSSVTNPVPIPRSTSGPHVQIPSSGRSSSPSRSPYGNALTSSESDNDNAPPMPASGQPHEKSSPSKYPAGVKDPSKAVQSGYLMKCTSRRHNWHKRWFVLSGEQLFYSRSHMDTKPHRVILLAQILDALEYDMPTHRHTPSVTPPGVSSPPVAAGHGPGDEGLGSHQHTFKIVTTKRTLLLSAPNEEEEIKWLSAIRALLVRRSDAGVVPGDTPVVSPSGRIGAPGERQQAQGGVGAGGGAPGRRRESVARRLSVSGGGGANVPGEGVSER